MAVRNHTRTTRIRDDAPLLRTALTDIDELAQQGFSEIQTLAQLALAALDTPEGRGDAEIVGHALTMIHNTAERFVDCIGAKAEAAHAPYASSVRSATLGPITISKTYPARIEGAPPLMVTPPKFRPLSASQSFSESHE